MVLSPSCANNGASQILERYVQLRTAKHYISLSPDDLVNYNGLAGTTEGYSPMDLIDLVGRAVHTAAVRQGDKVHFTVSDYKQLIKNVDCYQEVLEFGMQDFLAAQKGFVPLALRDISLTKGETVWGDIGGKLNQSASQVDTSI